MTTGAAGREADIAGLEQVVVGHVEAVEVVQAAHHSGRERPEVVVREDEFLQSEGSLEAVHVEVHQDRGPVGVVRLEAEALQVGEAGKGSSRNVPDLAVVDGQLLQVGKSSEVFGLQLRLVEEDVGALEVQHLSGVDVFVTGVDARLQGS